MEPLRSSPPLTSPYGFGPPGAPLQFGATTSQPTGELTLNFTHAHSHPSSASPPNTPFLQARPQPRRSRQTPPSMTSTSGNVTPLSATPRTSPPPDGSQKPRQSRESMKRACNRCRQDKYVCPPPHNLHSNRIIRVWCFPIASVAWFRPFGKWVWLTAREMATGTYDQ